MKMMNNLLKRRVTTFLLKRYKKNSGKTIKKDDIPLKISDKITNEDENNNEKNVEKKNW